jgi:hypothetical protein
MRMTTGLSPIALVTCPAQCQNPDPCQVLQRDMLLLRHLKVLEIQIDVNFA